MVRGASSFLISIFYVLLNIGKSCTSESVISGPDPLTVKLLDSAELSLKRYGILNKVQKIQKTQVKKESRSVGLEKEDAMNRARWRVGVGEIAVGVG